MICPSTSEIFLSSKIPNIVLVRHQAFAGFLLTSLFSQHLGLSVNPFRIVLFDLRHSFSAFRPYLSDSAKERGSTDLVCSRFPLASRRTCNASSTRRDQDQISLSISHCGKLVGLAASHIDGCRRPFPPFRAWSRKHGQDVTPGFQGPFIGTTV